MLVMRPAADGAQDGDRRDLPALRQRGAEGQPARPSVPVAKPQVLDVRPPRVLTMWHSVVKCVPTRAVGTAGRVNHRQVLGW